MCRPQAQVSLAVSVRVQHRTSHAKPSGFSLLKQSINRELPRYSRIRYAPSIRTKLGGFTGISENSLIIALCCEMYY